MNRSRN